jgi:hypothetical protein
MRGKVIVLREGEPRASRALDHVPPTAIINSHKSRLKIGYRLFAKRSERLLFIDLVENAPIREEF